MMVQEERGFGEPSKKEFQEEGNNDTSKQG